jgi:hypothetical protein
MLGDLSDPVGRHEKPAAALTRKPQEINKIANKFIKKLQQFPTFPKKRIKITAKTGSVK